MHQPFTVHTHHPSVTHTTRFHFCTRYSSFIPHSHAHTQHPSLHSHTHQPHFHSYTRTPPLPPGCTRTHTHTISIALVEVRYLLVFTNVFMLHDHSTHSDPISIPIIPRMHRSASQYPLHRCLVETALAALKDTPSLPPHQNPSLRAHLALEKLRERRALPGGWAQLECHSWNPPHSSLLGLPTWLQLAAGVFLPCRCVGGGGGGRSGKRALALPGQDAGGGGGRAGTSGLWQPSPGPQKVGAGQYWPPG
jgi:hypothetical protein